MSRHYLETPRSWPASTRRPEPCGRPSAPRRLLPGPQTACLSPSPWQPTHLAVGDTSCPREFAGRRHCRVPRPRLSLRVQSRYSMALPGPPLPTSPCPPRLPHTPLSRFFLSVGSSERLPPRRLSPRRPFPLLCSLMISVLQGQALAHPTSRARLTPGKQRKLRVHLLTE